jgi:hypothetical protein
MVDKDYSTFGRMLQPFEYSILSFKLTVISTCLHSILYKIITAEACGNRAITCTYILISIMVLHHNFASLSQVARAIMLQHLYHCSCKRTVKGEQKD